MRRVTGLGVPSVLLLLLVAAVDVGGQRSIVLEFHDYDFQAQLEQHEVIMVEFYAPWCGHCKKFAPEYEKAADRLLKNDPPVPLAKVDCIAEAETCEGFKVTAYPKLKIFKKGKFEKDYEGPRTADNVYQAMARLAGPISKQLTTVEAYEKFLDKPGVCIIGFFRKAKSSLAATFQQVAEEYGDLRFAHTSSKQILEHANYKDVIVVFRPKVMENRFEENAAVYDAEPSTNTIKAFIDMHRFGLVGHRDAANAEKFRKPLFVAFYEVDYTRNPKGTNYWRNRIMKVAAQILRERMAFFAITHREEHAPEVQDCGLGGIIGEKPVVCAYDDHHRKFKMEEEFSVENFDKFVRAVLAEDVFPYIKSEPIPKTNEQPVKRVVGRTFNDIVNDKEKDVLIEFYAPWCTHCQELAPKYKRVGDLLKDEPNIVVAKMDATSNDAPTPYEIKGFPDIYFAKKGNKMNPARYLGPREVKEIIQFVTEEATDDLVGFDRYGNRLDPSEKKEF